MRYNLPDRTFGVELEIIGLGISRAVQTLRDAGFDAVEENDGGSCNCDDCRRERMDRGEDPDDYDDNEPDMETQWIVKYDGSLSGSGACEITSPILRGTDGLAKLRKACEALVARGATVNETCGLHVHIGAGDLSPSECASVCKRYARWESVIDQFMHERRRSNYNTYCQSIRRLAEHIRPEHFGRRWDVMDITGHDRYYKVNPTSLEKYGTIEFRHHNGAVNPDTVTNWVTFLLFFVERSRALVKPGNRCRDLRVFTGAPKAVEAFYVRRVAHLGDNRSASAWG